MTTLIPPRPAITTAAKVAPLPKASHTFNPRWVDPKPIPRVPTYQRISQVPFSKKRILRDALHPLIPERHGLQLFGYHGTTIKSTRSLFRRYMQSADLIALGISFDEAGDPLVREKSRAAAIYPHVDEWVTPAGDLRKRPDPQHGCFGVPYWRALDLKCGDCPLRDTCDGVVSYRLTFGGRSVFDDALGEKAQAASWYDKKARTGQNQGYEREAEDPKIRQLRSAYTAIWYLSDLTLKKRQRQALKAEAKAAEDADHAATAAVRQSKERADFEGYDRECRKLVRQSIDSHLFAAVSSGLRGFFDACGDDRRWRKRKGSVIALALTQVGEQASRYAATLNPNWEKFCTDKHIVAIAQYGNELLHPSGCDLPTAALSYDAVRRHMNTLREIELASAKS